MGFAIKKKRTVGIGLYCSLEAQSSCVLSEWIQSIALEGGISRIP